MLLNAAFECLEILKYKAKKNVAELSQIGCIYMHIYAFPEI